MNFVLLRNRKGNGFTLIELLVVIAIIGVLAASVFSVLNPLQQLARARDAIRIADIKNIENALAQYYVNHGKYPDATICDSSIGKDDTQPCQSIAPQGNWSTQSGIYDLVKEGYLKNLPKDPKNDQYYYYVYEPETDPAVCAGASSCKYWIEARLEAPKDTSKHFFACSDNETLGSGCTETAVDVGMYAALPGGGGGGGGGGGSGGGGSVSIPIRAAFYYAWYPEQWSSAGHRYTSVLGEYSSSDTTIIDDHINQMKYAKIDAGLYSWWGPGHPTDTRFSAFLDRAEASGFKWGIYYELDYDSSRTSAQIQSDMSYLKDNYFSRPGYLRVNGKPVVFVYQPYNGSCVSVAKWTDIRNQFGLYVSLMDVPEWWTCNTLDSWHGYKSDSRVKSVYEGSTVYSLSVSAGFWAAWEPTERLSRDFAEWQAGVSTWAMYKPQWQLVYFNEFGEGTNIEPSNARCLAPTCSDYLQTLNQAPKN